MSSKALRSFFACLSLVMIIGLIRGCAIASLLSDFPRKCQLADVKGFNVRNSDGGRRPEKRNFKIKVLEYCITEYMLYSQRKELFFRVSHLIDRNRMPPAIRHGHTI